jgi:hypothetical protein
MPFLHKKEKSSPSLSRSQDHQVMLAQKKKNLDLRNSQQRMERDSATEEEEEAFPMIDPEILKDALKKLNVKFIDVEE